MADTAFGIQPSGFVCKQPSDIQSDLQTGLQAAFGQSINLTSASWYGQLVAFLLQPLSELWALLQAIYAAGYPAGATGQSADNVAQLTGCIRQQPTPSTVTATLTGTPGTVVPTTTLFGVLNTGVQFQPVAAVTIGAGGTVACPCQSVLTGPQVCPAGQLVTINTPVAGLSAVTNVAQAVVGTNLELDPALMLRREELLTEGGAATPPAVLADILAVPGVTQATVFENFTDTTDVNGVPPHSINPVVSGTAAPAAVAAAIFNSKAAGVNTYGAAAGGTPVSTVVTDAQGGLHTINYQVPAQVNFFVSITLKTNPLIFPAGGAALLQTALNAYALTIPVAGTAVASALEAVAFAGVPSAGIAPIPGILDVTAFTLGLAASPTGTANIIPGARTQLLLPTANVAVTVT